MIEPSQLECRLKLLEAYIAFQEVTIEELNQTVVAHNHDISRMQEQLRLLADKLHAHTLSILAWQSEETPPPHY